jgi:hypothetical protein
MGTDSNGLLTNGGAFDQIKSVRKGRGGCMSLAQSIIGDLIALDEEDLTAGFVAPPPCSALRLAERFPNLEGYWNASDVAMVLDGELAWKRITFQANDAVEFRDPKAPSHTVQEPGGAKCQPSRRSDIRPNQERRMGS